MHEFSLCQSLLKEACKIAATKADTLSQKHKQQTPVTMITALTVRMGLFAGIDKHLLQRAFGVAIHDHHRYWPGNKNLCEEQDQLITFSPTAQLKVEELAGAIFCRECNRNYRVDQQVFNKHYLTCGINPEHHTHLVGGDELLLVNVQLQQISLQDFLKKSDQKTAESWETNP